MADTRIGFSAPLHIVDREHAEDPRLERISRASMRGLASQVRRVKSLWLEEQAAPEWIAAYRIAVVDGLPVLGEVRIFPGRLGASGRIGGEWEAEQLGSYSVPPAGGVPATAVRSVAIGRFLVPLLEQMKASQTIASEFPGLLTPARPAATRAPRKGGRPGRPDAFYAEVAHTYVDWLARGRRDPVQHISATKGVEPSRVRGWIAEARRRGLLHPQRKQGQVTRGALTEKGRQALRPGRRS